MESRRGNVWTPASWRENIRYLKLYLERELRIRSEISAQLESASGDAAKKRRMEVEEEKQLILTALKRYES